GGVDPRRVRGLTPLPAAQGELEAMRAAVGAAQARLMVDVELREDAVRALRWSDYRVVAFAPHGFLAAGSGAPGQVLVLTPPGSRTPTDDGVLSSAEIRSFKFDADLVILSACDTGATTEAVGASFADAFLAAGARSVVVSRWPLLSDTAALLTLPLVREAAQRGSGHLADAERDAILALLRDPPRPELRHPMFWAAFTVVGDFAGGPS
ncbi:MAG TPA: CHAT domain-containing protein, partial [Phenylobacterium sp.]